MAVVSQTDSQGKCVFLRRIFFVFVFLLTNRFVFTVHASFYLFPFCLNFHDWNKTSRDNLLCSHQMLVTSVISKQVHKSFLKDFHTHLRSI